MLLNRKAVFPLFLLLCMSCNGKREKIKTSNHAKVETEYYPNGKLKTILQYENNKLTGQSIWFYIKGNIEQTLIFQKGKAEGHAFNYYQSGAIKSHRFYLNDSLEGYAADYYDTSVGIIKNILLFGKGKLLYQKEVGKNGSLIREEGRRY